jgi:hypothetical protein
MQFLAMPRVQFDFANIADSQNVSANMLYAPNVSVAKEHLDQIGGFDEALTYGYQDCDLGLRLAQRGVRFVYRAEALVWHDHPNSVRGYVQRQMRIHQFWAVMAKRYPHIAKLEIMARQLDHYVPRLGQLEQLTLLAEKADARYGVRHALEHQDRQRLFALFDTLGTLAAVKGMVRDVAGLQEVLDVRHRPWYGSLGAPRPVPGLAPESPN